MGAGCSDGTQILYNASPQKNWEQHSQVIYQQYEGKYCCVESKKLAKGGNRFLNQLKLHTCITDKNFFLKIKQSENHTQFHY